MVNYSKVSAEDCENLECLAEAYNLFALFDTPANVIFVDQFISNINKFKDIFTRYFSRQNIFFSCKCNKSFALLKYASEQDCGIEVASNYELNDALKFTKKVIASGPAKDDEYLNNSIDNDVLISVDDIEELKRIKEINRPVRVLLRISDLLGKVSRFGININQIDLCLDIISNSLIQLKGFSFHINNYSLDDRVNAINEVLELTESKNLNISFIDIGGGIPTNYCSKDDYNNFLKQNNKEMYFKEHFINDYYPYYSEIADEKALDYIFKKVYKKLVETDNLLPIKISDFYMKKLIEEIDTIGKGGPLYRSVIPVKDKIELKTSVETRDYVEEDKHNPVENCDYIIQKYEDRLVFIITDVCFAHCQYCFRTYNLSKFQQSNLKETIKNKISVLKKYLQSHLNIREVIFSGGDPLSIGYENMKFALDELKEWDIRIHTRAIAYEPSIFTKKMIDLLNEHNVRLVFHINHPYEIDEVVEEKINEIRKAGIRMYSQFPLLRGINDNSKVLIKLLIKMDELNIRPLSIFIPDPISYGAVNRISVSRIEKIMDEVNWNTPSWVNSTRFVMDTTIGKVRRENIIKREGKCITFSRDGKTVDYYDLDDGIDVPSPIDKLLWKN